MLKLLKIDNIMYRVKDLEKSRKFYENVLGMRKTWSDVEAMMIGFCFDTCDSEIVITSDPDLPKFDHVYLVENVEEFCALYKKLGYKLALKPIPVRCGKYAILKDLDNNRIPIIDLTSFDNKPRYN